MYIKFRRYFYGPQDRLFDSIEELEKKCGYVFHEMNMNFCRPRWSRSGRWVHFNSRRVYREPPRFKVATMEMDQCQIAFLFCPGTFHPITLYNTIISYLNQTTPEGNETFRPFKWPINESVQKLSPQFNHNKRWNRLQSMDVDCSSANDCTDDCTAAV